MSVSINLAIKPYRGTVSNALLMSTVPVKVLSAGLVAFIPPEASEWCSTSAMVFSGPDGTRVGYHSKGRPVWSCPRLAFPGLWKEHIGGKVDEWGLGSLLVLPSFGMVMILAFFQMLGTVFEWTDQLKIPVRNRIPWDQDDWVGKGTSCQHPATQWPWSHLWHQLNWTD